MNSPDMRDDRHMRLRILLPTEVLLDMEVEKVIAEAVDGAFCLLPRHVDFVAALVPGVLLFVARDGAQGYAAVDEGVLVKCGREVSVSTLNGAQGDDLVRLQDLVEARYVELDEHERKTRAALARLEAGTLRGFCEMQENRHG
jgi:F-type H+-transporting ATPase subunit epsilon